MNKMLLKAMQRRVAESSIGVSTIRNMGPGGTAKAVREWLAEVNLTRFSVTGKPRFNEQLNAATKELRAILPKKNGRGGHWGTARKCLNIFLRNVVYNRHLCEAYRLTRIEPWLEVPLDSHVAKALRRRDGQLLGRWPGVIHLDWRLNAKYQEWAVKVAEGEATLRIHLDLLYWRQVNGETVSDD